MERETNHQIRGAVPEASVLGLSLTTGMGTLSGHRISPLLGKKDSST